MGLKSGIVELYPYDKKWIKEFQKEKTNLKNIFKDIAVSIEHIGSTSIIGLKSKPIIDIAVGVNSLENFERVRLIFENSKEYRVKENPTPGEQLVIKEKNNETTHLIHIMEYKEQRYIETILFRDYLINNEEMKIEYQELKERLAKEYADNRKMYTASKNDFIKNIILKAQKK